MKKDLNIKVEVKDEKQYEVKVGSKIEDIIFEDYIKDSCPKVVGVKILNEVVSLDYELQEDTTLELLHLGKTNGIRIYKRSAILIFIKAVTDVFENSRTRIMHSINKGVYCEVELGRKLLKEDIEKIDLEMRRIIDEDIKIEKLIMPKDEAITLFEKLNMLDKVKLLENRDENYVELHKLGWLYDLGYETAVPSTGYIQIYELQQYGNGIILRFPSKECPCKLPPYVKQEKMGYTFEEHKKWLDILNVSTVSDLNGLVKNNEINEFVRVAEALQEKKIANIADMILENRKNVFLVLIAGPSSSGKTTFANRLAVQLRVNGLRPFGISLDDYFLDREHTPKDEKGRYDFEVIEALDLELFNHNLQTLLKGETAEIPSFNFHSGKREPVGRKVKLESDQVIVVEGIHGLNEKLTESIDRNNKFKIYVSALTQLNVDNYTRIPTTDLRLIRRIVRDSKYRSSSAANTIKIWPSVRRGEEKYIFPYQEEADIIFNSALTYELPVLKKLAEPLLKDIQKSEFQYTEAQRLLRLLKVFTPVSKKEIPINSIIREFIGGSCFYDA